MEKLKRLPNYYIKTKDHQFPWFRSMINQLECNVGRINLVIYQHPAWFINFSEMITQVILAFWSVLAYDLFNNLKSVLHASVLLLIMNFVEALTKCGGDSQVDPQTTLTMSRPNSLSITGQTHEKLTSMFFFYDNKRSNRPLVFASHKLQILLSLHLLKTRISQWAGENLCNYRKIADGRTIGVIIAKIFPLFFFNRGKFWDFRQGAYT